mmetsp:Transcript_7634/g.19601  ORF Transcript_7634/g.19601 Transcript_7634/m.19601 type:complete len:377 (+) Transcript_7634:2041-3171(+)
MPHSDHVAVLVLHPDDLDEVHVLSFIRRVAAHRVQQVVSTACGILLANSNPSVHSVQYDVRVVLLVVRPQLVRHREGQSAPRVLGRLLPVLLGHHGLAVLGPGIGRRLRDGATIDAAELGHGSGLRRGDRNGVAREEPVNVAVLVGGHLRHAGVDVEGECRRRRIRGRELLHGDDARILVHHPYRVDPVEEVGVVGAGHRVVGRRAAGGRHVLLADHDGARAVPVYREAGLVLEVSVADVRRDRVVAPLRLVLTKVFGCRCHADRVHTGPRAGPQVARSRVPRRRLDRRDDHRLPPPGAVLVAVLVRGHGRGALGDQEARLRGRALLDGGASHVQDVAVLILNPDEVDPMDRVGVVAAGRGMNEVASRSSDRAEAN